MRPLELDRVLQTLCGTCAPSGFEQAAARAAGELLAPLVDEVWFDRMGNLAGVLRCGRSGAKKVLLDAHLDEVGFLVTGVEDGLLRLRAIGGVDPRMLPGGELTILADPPLLGVVALPGDRREQDRAVPLEELRVDVGMSQQAAARRIPAGTPAVFRGGCFALGGDKLYGKAMDDRSCFAALLCTAELLRGRTLDVDVYFLGSSREETSGTGALAGVFAIAPDYCVAVDVTHGATPDAPRDRTFPLKGGPAIGVGPNMTRWMTQRMICKAKQLDIPYQLEVMGGSSGTNGWKVQTAREGIATAVLSVPLRYMHSPVEVLAREDLEQTARLLAAFVEGLGEEAPVC